MNIMKRLRRWYRILQLTIRSIIQLPGKLNLIDMIIHAFSFPQHEWAKRMRLNLADDESSVSWQQAINPLYWTAWGVRFLGRWIVTRPYMTLTPAIPSILVASILIATVFVIIRREESETQTIYLDTMRASMASGDTAVASVAAQRLLAIDPEDLENQFQLAMLDDELGKEVSARAAIFRLGIEREYGPAALWILRSLIYDHPTTNADGELGNQHLVKRKSWTEQEQAVCHRCATVAMTKLPSKRAVFAKKMYAGFLADNGFTGDALRLYNTIASTEPGVNLVAAQLAARNHDYTAAQRFAKSAIRFLEPTMLENLTSIQARLNFAQALVLDEQDDRAYELLLAGCRITPSPILAAAAGEALVFKAERLRRELGNDETLVKRFELMTEAVQLAPQSPLVLESVIHLAIECSEAEDGKLPFRRKLLQGVNPTAMHFVEGTILLMAGDVDAAQKHLELATRDGAKMAGLLNNLAYTLLASDKKNLPKALRFSEEALRQLPGHPSLLDTRGQILLKMGRYQDAISDLEKACAAPDLRHSAHLGLVQAYQALGVEDLAEENRILARQYAGPKQDVSP